MLEILSHIKVLIIKEVLTEGQTDEQRPINQRASRKSTSLGMVSHSWVNSIAGPSNRHLTLTFVCAYAKEFTVAV